MRTLLLGCLLIAGISAFAQRSPFESGNGNQTPVYPEVLSFYRKLARAHPEARLIRCGQTDSGEPLQLLVLSRRRIFDPETIRKQHLSILLISNGIHPGEPEGIDASMMLARDLLRSGGLPERVVICILPVYNIDGALNRNSTTRANQNGPEAYGFRGNARNYDLNRDFIKTDSRNSAAFQQLFNYWKPEVFVDTHTSNGADYQYTMTLIPTQKDKLNPILSAYLTGTMLPALYTGMEQKGYPPAPYINSIGETPDTGITGFPESPRYSTGYAALHNTIGFMPETHMLKPYPSRVKSTYLLLQTYIELVNRDADLIRENRRRADLSVAAQPDFPLRWVLDRSRRDSLLFKGYAAAWKPSLVSGAQRLYYDRNRPYSRYIPYFNTYIPEVTVRRPLAYLIPAAYSRVAALLRLNGLRVQRLSADALLPVESYYISSYQTAPKPYEGHYLHSDTQVSSSLQQRQFRKGDYIVYANQPGNRYLVETLEPQATDSFFNWNFFDSILDQKEHYSAYVFEDTAGALLREQPGLRRQLQERLAADTAFARNPAAQLDFVYRHSNYYENTHLRYPIARLQQSVTLKLNPYD